MPPWTRNYLGIPFKDMGRTYTGADCWGIVHLVYEHQYGVRLPLYVEDYYRSTDKPTISEIIRGRYQEQSFFHVVKQPCVGDVILVKKTDDPFHVGVFLGHEGGHPYMLHTTKFRGQSYCQRLDDSVFRHADLTYHRH